MSVEALISRLDGVRQTGPDRWIARCPAHEDKSPSMSVRALPDGRTLAHCFAGCRIDEVMSSIGLEMSVLFPDGQNRSDPRTGRRPYSAGDIIKCLAAEAFVLLDCSRQMRAGKALSEQDHARLVTACGRIVAGMDIANG